MAVTLSSSADLIAASASSRGNSASPAMAAAAGRPRRSPYLASCGVLEALFPPPCNTFLAARLTGSAARGTFLAARLTQRREAGHRPSSLLPSYPIPSTALVDANEQSKRTAETEREGKALGRVRKPNPTRCSTGRSGPQSNRCVGPNNLAISREIRPYPQPSYHHHVV